ncbi:MAG: insulinase family protein [Nitrospirae bacterium CG_4_10_14_3_um_filter_44_29]|nr:insulinase family protein [Nitrospirota bacterium]OIO31931.1 MAG: peptidase M16 [Nitrospirae bacterium CG1_02_44_142]PIP69689.1 MAG: peptidase M16 [Nitrospirae bacterium CG22_combo_CG10-13_8_21_14_all_44_11]PIV42659.1 MAG: insulinase family protein [Nitrospirae bacterium CG02_land_8_20_14_3_00_44_33]PIV65434.1 MAG: insulinase family protein [Nitrospirae bacterium CG01_land_8_20_14_3_00_44_22]PIW88892.1 MAG: insulinase family protein [Nitrospirae bacterium CG_4_8_14_3_um_filter_44_28]PIX887
MRKLALLIFIFLLLPLSLKAEVNPVRNTVSNGVKEYKLDNGLKVLVIEDHKSPLATFQIWYRVGSRDEPAGKSGISHLLEHMMFKGTQKYGSKAFSKMVKKNGGVDNAFTTKDYTMYYQTLVSDRIDISIELEADRMQNLILAPKEVIAERDVVMEERRMRYDDDPQNSLYEEVVAAAFKSHSYHWPVIGWMSDISSIERNGLLGHYKAYYSPDNAVIVVSGDIQADEIIKKIKASFGDIAPASGRVVVTSKESEQKGERRISLKREAELPYIITVYHTPSFPHPDSYALEVLGMILSGGKSSRLYMSIIYEKKLAISASADYSGLNKDPYLFLFAAAAAPGKDIKDVENALDAEIEKIKREPPTEREVQKAKNQIEASFVMGQDSIYFQAEITGMFEMLGSWKLKEQYLENIRKITPEDVSRAAKKYLHEDNRTVGILIPIKK